MKQAFSAMTFVAWSFRSGMFSGVGAVLNTGSSNIDMKRCNGAVEVAMQRSAATAEGGMSRIASTDSGAMRRSL